jgi:pimeloyl-ACP methyl ester carboxylesterase
VAVHHVESEDGTPIAYRRWGSGEAVVFVHGSATSATDWNFLRPLLRDEFTVVAMDRRGRGASGDAPDYAMDREAEDILAVLEANDANLLVGHSYGALCSILAAVRTDRLGRLVLYEPPIAVRGGDWIGGLEELVGRGELSLVLEEFLRGAGAPADQLDLIRASPAWPVLLDAVPALPREMRAAAAWGPPPGPIDVPTLFLTGGDTRGDAYLDGLEELHSAFTDLRSARIPGQQHLAHVFAAEVFADLIVGFLRDD